jgi:hypothetical protein
VTERDDDLRPGGVGSKEVDDSCAQPGRRISGQRGDALGIEEHHPGPADALSAALRHGEVHDEEVSLVVEGVLEELEIRQPLAAEVPQQREVLLSPFERLFHRDHPVPEHACLAHRLAPSVPHPITSPLSRKISRAMISRWISLVPS